MMRTTVLPTEFSSLQSKIDYIRQWTSDEWSSSCPQCGGQPHKDGSYPDRFRMWTNASGKNKVMGWCRRCGYIWFPNNDKPISKEEFDRWRSEQIAREEQRKKEAENAIQLLRSQKIWEQYHLALKQSAYGISVVESWGITRPWAELWKIGFIQDYTVHSKDGEYHKPAISIPVWQMDGSIGNVKVRVIDPKNSNDRYRKVYKTGQDSLFWTEPKRFDTCLLVEGEKKAMVCRTKTIKGIQVVGLPTKTPNIEMLRQLDSFKKMYVCLDPDATEDGSLDRLVKSLGKFRTNVITLPDKIDDMINGNSLNVMDAIKYSTPWRT